MNRSDPTATAPNGDQDRVPEPRSWLIVLVVGLAFIPFGLFVWVFAGNPTPLVGAAMGMVLWPCAFWGLERWINS